MTKKGKNQHVVRRDDGWAVLGEGNSRDTLRTNTQREAVERAREIAKNQGSEVVIHGRDGTIREKNYYGSDPWPPSDRVVGRTGDSEPRSKRDQPVEQSDLQTNAPQEERYLADRIVVSREVLHGKPRIAGTRIMVYQILDLLSAGKPVEEIISDEYFPDITAEDVYACVEYASRILRNDEIIPL